MVLFRLVIGKENVLKHRYSPGEGFVLGNRDLTFLVEVIYRMVFSTSMNRWFSVFSPMETRM